MRLVGKRNGERGGNRSVSSCIESQDDSSVFVSRWVIDGGGGGVSTLDGWTLLTSI